MAEPLAARVLFPLTERTFTYASYDELLERLADRERFVVVRLKELAATSSPDRVIVALRHDADSRLESALAFARMEHAHGLRSTYFILHTAPYYGRREPLLRALHALQDTYGHEIGWHNDLVTLQCVLGQDSRAYAGKELRWLRANGIEISGVAAHGSPWCRRLGYHNDYFFEELSRPVPGLPNVDVVPIGNERCVIAKARLADYGFRYDAAHLDRDVYFSDASFDARGRRRHPSSLDLDAVEPGQRVILLLHPCHWDSGLRAKVMRLGGRIARRVVGRRSQVAAVPAHARASTLA